ncbi:MAG: hypothetical protein NUV50_00020 [Rhodospirillales bacterium]|nr:hypothetical protein [Rhodospirillales bacterium]
MADTTPSEWFQKALTAYGQNYLDAEQALRSGGEATATVLKQIVMDPKQAPLAQFIAATITAWIEGKGDNYQIAINGLSGLQVRAEQTILSAPSADVAAGRLARFDDISDFIALRMLKETDWPEWKVLAAIVYLGYWGTGSVLPAIDQFRADLKNGTRPQLGDILNEQTDSVIEKLDEAASLVRIVIQDEAFKTDLAKVKATSGSEQQAAAEEAVARAISLITADPERAQQLSAMSDTLNTLVLTPILKATEGTVAPDQVRSILAVYLFGNEKSDLNNS